MSWTPMKKIKPETASQHPGNGKGAKKADPELDFPRPDTEPIAPKPPNKSEIENPKSEINNNSAIDVPHSEIQTTSNIEHPNSEISHNSAIDIPHSEIQTKFDIENPKSEIKMEVHHHPEVEKKGFKEYLLEGLMIFLAVNMGFFAESLREHIAEHDRANEIIAAFVKDIKKDTASLNNAINVYMPAHNQWVDSAD